MIDRMLVALYTLLGLLPLGALPALFYLLVFGHNHRVDAASARACIAMRARTPMRGRILMHDLVLSVTVANGVLLAVMVVLGLLGWFRLWMVGGLTLALLVAPTPLWRRLFAPEAAYRGCQFIRGSAALTREHQQLLVLFLLFSLGVLAIRRYPYHSDTWGKYLGAGATVAETGRIPSLDMAALQVDYTNAPLVMLYTAWEFSFWGRDDRVARAIPVYFTTVTLLLLFAWGNAAHSCSIPSPRPTPTQRRTTRGVGSGTWRTEYVQCTVDAASVPDRAGGQDVFPHLVTALLIGSQAFLRSFVGIIQEPPLLFFVTLAFYFLWRYSRPGRSLTNCKRSSRATQVDYGLAIIACTCALLTKFSAPIPILLIGFALLIGHPADGGHPRQLVPKLAWGALLSWPATLWLGRNWAIWGNPIYPQLEHLLGCPGRLHELTLLSSQIASVNLQAAWISPAAFLLDMALTFPFAPLAAVRMVRERKHPLTWILVVWGLATLAFLLVTGARWLERYFYGGIGLYALYAALGALDIRAHVLWRTLGQNASAPGAQREPLPRWVSPALVSLLMLALLVSLYLKHPVPYAGRPYEEATVSYFQAHVPEGETVTLLVDASLVTWYDPARAYRQWRFHDLPFLLATDGHFDPEQDAAYLHDELARVGVLYVYSSPQRKTRPHFWEEVAGHPEYFEPVLDAYGAHLWRVRADESTELVAGTLRLRDG
jgi:hypothetical protein